MDTTSNLHKAIFFLFKAILDNNAYVLFHSKHSAVSSLIQRKYTFTDGRTDQHMKNMDATEEDECKGSYSGKGGGKPQNSSLGDAI
jgi:hypothetical protein